MLRALSICVGFVLLGAAPCFALQRVTINCRNGCSCIGGAQICPRINQNLAEADFTLPPEKFDQFKSILEHLEPVNKTVGAETKK